MIIKKIKEMNKEFEHRGYKFNIKAEINPRVECKMNCGKWNAVITNCMDFDNYYKKETVKDEFLIICVENAERFAKRYVDDKALPTSGVNGSLLLNGLPDCQQTGSVLRLDLIVSM